VRHVFSIKILPFPNAQRRTKCPSSLFFTGRVKDLSTSSPPPRREFHPSPRLNCRSDRPPSSGFVSRMKIFPFLPLNRLGPEVGLVFSPRALAGPVSSFFSPPFQRLEFDLFAPFPKFRDRSFSVPRPPLTSRRVAVAADAFSFPSSVFCVFFFFLESGVRGQILRIQASRMSRRKVSLIGIPAGTAPYNRRLPPPPLPDVEASFWSRGNFPFFCHPVSSAGNTVAISFSLVLTRAKHLTSSRETECGSPSFLLYFFFPPRVGRLSFPFLPFLGGLQVLPSCIRLCPWFSLFDPVRRAGVRRVS